MDRGQFNPSTYQGMDPSEVNWAHLAQQWINARPPPPLMRTLHPPAPFPPRPYQHPNFYGGGGDSPCYPYGPVPLSSQRFPAHPYLPPPAPRHSLGFFDNPSYYGAALPPRMMQPPHHSRMPFHPPPLPPQPPQHSMGFFSAPIAQRPTMPVPPFVENMMRMRHPSVHAPSCQPTASSVWPSNDEYHAYYDPSLEPGQRDEPKPVPKARPDETDDTGAMSHWLSGDINPADTAVASGSQLYSTTGPQTRTTHNSSKSQLSQWMMAELCWQGVQPSSGGCSSLLEEASYMGTTDQQTRKRLPAWILEGMEKAEREKRRKLEREGKRQSLQQEREQGDDDEDAEDSDANEERTDVAGTNGKSCSPAQSAEAKGHEQSAELLGAIRKLMTSILLDTTDGHIARLAKEVLTKQRTETAASPKILAKSSALAAISALGGDDDDSSGGEEEDVSSREKCTPSSNLNTTPDFKAPKLPSNQRQPIAPRTRLGSGEITPSTSSIPKAPPPKGDEHRITTRRDQDDSKAADERGSERYLK